MKKLFKVSIPLLILTLSFASCTSSKIPERETIPQKEITESQTDNQAKENLQKIENEKISAFVNEYNSKQTYKALQVADDYNIYLDQSKGIYYIKSGTVDLTIRTNADGEVISAANTGNDDIEQQLAVSNVIIDLLWNKDIVTEEQRQKINEIYEQAEKMKEIIVEKTCKFESNNGELNTSLPEATLPIK